jgi:hypothetical protein
MQKKLLNVGGNSKAIAIPAHYDGWTHHLLDIDPTGNPDIVCDARNLEQITSDDYDSVYCSHNLEHYYSHDVLKVLKGFHHILKSDGFAHIRVPDIQALMQHVVKNNMDINDILYQSPAGPIAVKDVIYGFGKQIERSGQDFYAHKTGFSTKSLLSVLKECGFPITYYSIGYFEISVFAFKQKPSEYVANLLKLPVAA